MKGCFVTTLLCLILSVSGFHQFYNESLDLTPLPRNNLLASFNFEVKSLQKQLKHYGANTSDISSSGSHYTYFPRSIGPILEKTNTRELHLRFAQGWWDSDIWGSLPFNGTKSGGTGVELWAVIEAKNSAEALENWKKLSVSLSAFFCASLNFIDDSITAFPVNTFQSQENSFVAEPQNKLFLMRAALPSEPICTENLTPFLKLLPTRGKAGVASLLNGHKVFDSLWHSMSVDITTECDSETGDCNFHMDQGISVIIDTMRSLRKKEEGSIPKPIPGDDLRCDKSRGYTIWQCFPLGLPTDISYTLKDIFGRRIQGGPFSKQSAPVTVNYKQDGWTVRFKHGLNKVISLSETDSTYDISGDEQIDIEFEATDSTKVKHTPIAPLHVSRSLTGYSQDSGGFRAVFENTGDKEIKFIYFETLPWFIRLYLSTLEASSKKIGTEDDNTVAYQNVEVSDYVNILHYHPAVDRKRPSHMELEITVPANETLTIHYQFDKSLLLYAEYPPDANHGFSVEPAVVSVLNEDNETVYQLRTTSSLVVLPTPDFSMPYNVIILTGTVLSLSFGSIFNLLIKDVITEEEFERLSSQSKVKKLVRGVKAKIGMVKSLVKSLLGK